MRMLLAAVAAALLATTAGAEGVFGTWQTEPADDGRYLHVETHPCATDQARVCGTIVGAFNGAREDSIGRAIVWDMVPDGANQWDDGKIWKADEDKIYNSEMALEGQVLKVSGCVLGGMICKSQRWQPVR